MEIYESAAKEYERNLSEMAYMMTYNEFIACVFFDLDSGDKIVGIDIVDNVLRIDYWQYCIHERGTKIKFISRYTTDVNEKDIQEKYGFDYDLNVFDNIDTRKYYIELLLYCSKDKIPPCLQRIKNKIDTALKELLWEKRMLMEYGHFNDYEILSADMIVDNYYNNLENDSFGELFYWCVRPTLEKCIVCGINEYRGRYKEQKIIANAIRCLSKYGKKCRLELWDLDSGFEELSSRLKELIKIGKVILALQRYKRVNNTKFIYR